MGQDRCRSKSAANDPPSAEDSRGALGCRKKTLEGWLWPADESSLKEQHTKTFRTLNQSAEKNELPRITPFVLYSFRHTFLTRLGQSAGDAWTLARIAGHSSIAISSRYVHPSVDTVLAALSRLGGHSSGHNKPQAE